VTKLNPSLTVLFGALDTKKDRFSFYIIRVKVASFYEKFPIWRFGSFYVDKEDVLYGSSAPRGVLGSGMGDRFP